MFLLYLMVQLIILLICLVVLAACGYVVIESYKYLKKTFNWTKKKKVQKTLL